MGFLIGMFLSAVLIIWMVNDWNKTLKKINESYHKPDQKHE